MVGYQHGDEPDVFQAGFTESVNPVSTVRPTIKQTSNIRVQLFRIHAWFATHAWQIWLVIGIFSFGASFGIPLSQFTLLYAAYNTATVLALLIGVRLHRPAHPTIWYLLGGSLCFHFGGDLIQVMSERAIHGHPHVTTIVHAVYLARYPLILLGLNQLIRSRNPQGDRASLIDATIVASGIFLLVWTFLVRPSLTAINMPRIEQIIAISYPLMDFLMLGVVTRFILAPGRRNLALLLLAVTIICELITNLVVTYLNLEATFDSSRRLVPLWIAIFIGWGIAALHPSMADLSQPTNAEDADTRLTLPRLLLLAAASLLVPLTLALQARLGRHIDVLLIGSISTFLFILVLVRMNGLIHMLTTALAKLGWAVTREQILRNASATLVASTTREEVWTATIETVRALRAGTPAGVIAVAVGTSSSMHVTMVAGQHGAGAQDVHIDLEQFPREIKDHLLSQQLVEIVLADYPRLWRLLGGDPEARVLLLTPLLFQQTFQALILVTSDTPIVDEFWGGMEALSAQITLALDSVELAKDLHRRRGEARFRSLVQYASDIVTVIDEEGIIRYESPAVQRILGYVPEQLIGTSTSSITHPDDIVLLQNFFRKVIGTSGSAPSVELRLRHRNGNWTHVEIAGSNLLHDPNVGGVVLNTRDISERKRFEEELQHQAFHDPLTNLPNRALFMARLEHTLSRPHRSPGSTAIIFLDLDGFKYVNDTLGHEIGDQLLISVAERLSGCIRPGDTAARFGGDEFTVLIEDIAHESVVTEIAQHIIMGLQAPFAIRHHEMFITASIGIAINTNANDASIDLLRYADTAMYAAKLSGKGQFKLFDTSMSAAAWERLELEYDLRLAIEKEEFKVYYQPLIALATGQITGMEALVRWQHPRRGLVPPGHFVPLAEETGLILQIGRLVLDQACRQTRAWQLLYSEADPLEISVNLSARQFQQPDLVESIARVLRDTSLPPSTLKLEITESDIMVDAQATIRKLHELKRLGVQLAIDDFGTGYSSLTYLKRFPIDTLKIDKAFVGGIVNSVEDKAIVQTVTSLAHTLDLTVTAEGVENNEVANHLRMIGCETGQGYFFSPPIAADATAALLQQRRKQPFPTGSKTSNVNDPPTHQDIHIRPNEIAV